MEARKRQVENNGVVVYVDRAKCCLFFVHKL